MKRSKFKEVFNRIMNVWPEHNSLICFTEAVLITSPNGGEIRRYFHKYVDKNDYKGHNPREIMQDTFGDMLQDKKSEQCERLVYY